MPGQRQQRLHQLRVAAEALRARHQPQVQLVFQVAQLALQLRRVALRVVHQVARMHLEEAGQNLPRGVGQVRPRAALNLREIALAQLRAGLGLDGPHQSPAGSSPGPGRAGCPPPRADNGFFRPASWICLQWDCRSIPTPLQYVIVISQLAINCKRILRDIFRR